MTPRISARPWVVGPISGTPFEQFERPAPTHDTSPLTTNALPPNLEYRLGLTPQGRPIFCYLPPRQRWKRMHGRQLDCSTLSKLSQLRELRELQGLQLRTNLPQIRTPCNASYKSARRCMPRRPLRQPPLMSHSARICADTSMSQMSQGTHTKNIFPDTNGVPSGAPPPVSRHNSQATDRSAEIQLTPSAVLGRVALASPAWGEEFYAHG